MLIGVISDTHDRLPAIDRAMALFAERRVEAVVHAGDLVAPFAARRLKASTVPLHVTYGNNDGERAGLLDVLPQIVDGPLHISLGGRNILVHHFIGWCSPEDIARAEIIITGHTHEIVNTSEDGKLYLNPGEACGWVSGRCTVAILDTAAPSATICDLDMP
jgi:uncharacterized protein